MRRLWSSLLILALLLSVTLYHTFRLNQFTTRLSQLLTQSEILAESGHWADASHMVDQVVSEWTEAGTYLHTTLQHADIDEIVLSLGELQEYIEHQELDQCTALTANLVAQLGLLSEMEQLTLRNIL